MNDVDSKFGEYIFFFCKVVSSMMHKYLIKQILKNYQNEKSRKAVKEKATLLKLYNLENREKYS